MAMLALACFCWTKWHYQVPDLQGKKINGYAEVELRNLMQSKTPFGTRWVYKGILRSFISLDAQTVAKNLPVSLAIPMKEVRPEAGYKYRLQAALSRDANGNYRLAPLKGHGQKIEKLWNLAEWRFHLKTSFQAHLQKTYKQPAVASFMSGIATGEFFDRLLAFDLKRVGLMHLMAISGLHFSLLAAFLFAGAGLLFSRKTAAAVVMLLLGLYFLFLGSSPSVFRAWIAIALALFSVFLQKPSQSLNSLGVALLAAIFWDPFWVKQIAFQFSFLITASILLFAGPCDQLLQKLFRKRELMQMIPLGIVDQYGYCLLTVLRKGLALALAVNLTALPLTLYHFQKFPLMNFLYNLFFPFLAAVCMLLLFLALASGLLLPWLGTVLHTLNASYTKWILKLVSDLPHSFDHTLHYTSLTTTTLACYLLLLFSAGILLHTKQE